MITHHYNGDIYFGKIRVWIGRKKSPPVWLFLLGVVVALPVLWVALNGLEIAIDIFFEAIKGKPRPLF